jgi:ketosteroid isomerase-like protein
MLAAFDAAFSADRGAEMGEFFAEDARLQWPEMEDIVGREAIRQAFVEFTSAFHTISWEPSYQVADVHGDRAYPLGRFVEIRQVRETGEVERVPGRIVYFCRREADGEWRLTHALTSRFGETTLDGTDATI